MDVNQDNLRRTKDGLYEAGVNVQKNSSGKHVARILLAYKGNPEYAGAPTEDVRTDLVYIMAPQPTFELAVELARERALERIPAIFGFDPKELTLTLMKKPRFT